MAAVESIDLGALAADPGYASGVLAVILRISDAADTGVAVHLLKDAAARLGVDSATFTSFVRDDATLASYRFLLACDPVWGLQYAKNNWCLDDPWLRYALYNTEPVIAEALPPAGERANRMWLRLGGVGGSGSVRQSNHVAHTLPAPSTPMLGSSWRLVVSAFTCTFAPNVWAPSDERAR